MKTKNLILGLGVAALFAACTPEESVPEYKAGEMSFKATFETIENGPAFAWKADDAISLYDGEENIKFTTAESGEEASFTGAANVNAENYSALYPYKEGLYKFSGKVALTIPASQEAVADGIDPKAHFAVAYEQNGHLQFKHMFALLKVNVAAADEVVQVQVTANGQEPIAGAVKVGPFDNPVIEADASSSDKVMLAGELDGTYYIAVMPQTLTAGYTITLTDANEMKYTAVSSDAVVWERGKVYDLGSYKDVDFEIVPNENPSAVPAIKVLKASFKEAEFNVLAEAGFEEYNDKDLRFRTSWMYWDQAKLETGHTGANAVMMDNPTPGVWGQIAQGVAMRPNTDYVYTVYVQGNCPNAYNGVVVHPGGFRNEIPGGDWQPKDSWHQLTKEFRTSGEYYAEVFAGLWGDAGMWFKVDDFKLIPKGYDKMSMDTKNTEVLNTTNTNLSFDEILSVGKIVPWKGTDGKIYMALYRPNVNGQVIDNCVAVTQTDDVKDGITMTRFYKKKGSITNILKPEEGKTVIPNSAFVLDGKVYLHYSIANINADGVVSGCDCSGFMVSEDNGETWTKGTGTWLGDSRYAQMSVTKKGDYLYAAGTTIGRSFTNWANTFVARIPAGQDLTDPGKWEYFNGTEWQADYLTLTPSCCLTVGDYGEPALVWNEKFGRFMMIYRSNMHGGLVYRDADSVDGYWSGEKLLSNDDVTGGRCFAPTVFEVTAEGELVIFAPTIGEVLNVAPFLI